MLMYHWKALSESRVLSGKTSQMYVNRMDCLNLEVDNFGIMRACMGKKNLCLTGDYEATHWNKKQFKW